MRSSTRFGNGKQNLAVPSLSSYVVLAPLSIGIVSALRWMMASTKPCKKCSCVSTKMI
ncbi:Uncharacterised protein [Vibrio cholerae]|nr:Uncharacterised protein [Vibrio cholerae]